MKTLSLALCALVVSSVSFAAAPSLVCKAKNGDVLTWTPKFGELTIENSRGQEIGSLDALVEGKAKRISMTKTVTPIEYGDEEPGSVVATIVDIAERVQIIMDEKVYNCLK
jgi:hypothetical protein